MCFRAGIARHRQHHIKETWPVSVRCHWTPQPRIVSRSGARQCRLGPVWLFRQHVVNLKNLFESAGFSSSKRKLSGSLAIAAKVSEGNPEIALYRAPCHQRTKNFARLGKPQSCSTSRCERHRFGWSPESYVPGRLPEGTDVYLAPQFKTSWLGK
jgi:hypothetical protein